MHANSFLRYLIRYSLSQNANPYLHILSGAKPRDINHISSLQSGGLPSQENLPRPDKYLKLKYERFSIFINRPQHDIIAPISTLTV